MEKMTREEIDKLSPEELKWAIKLNQKDLEICKQKIELNFAQLNNLRLQRELAQIKYENELKELRQLI